MVTAVYQQIYQLAHTLLQAMQQLNMAEPTERVTFAADLSSLQQLFQQGFAADLAALEAKVQPLQIEINKQLRLLETDAVFLKAARQPATIQQRSQQIQSRISLLLSYCESILSLCADSNADSNNVGLDAAD
jgi:hypothetical protein